MIEILKEDNINEDYFLIPNYEYNGAPNDKIYITQYPVVLKGKINYSDDLFYSEGSILYIYK